MSEQSENRRATLLADLEEFYKLYKDAPDGSSEMKHYEQLVQEVEDEIDAIDIEEQSDWGKNDDKLLRQWGHAPW